jgi:hypothetical protein
MLNVFSLFPGYNSRPPYQGASGSSKGRFEMIQGSNKAPGLTKEQIRNLPHPSDVFIKIEGIIRYGQAKFKVRDHGELYGLPYTLTNNGGTKTLRTEDNINDFMQGIANRAKNESIRRFDNGTYQTDTDQGYPAVHIYDMDERIISVFKKSTGEFATTCRLTDLEHHELLRTGYFGGGKDWFSSRVRNIPKNVTINTQNDEGTNKDDL